MSAGSVTRMSILSDLRAQLLAYQKGISFPDMLFSIGGTSSLAGYWRAGCFLQVLDEVLKGDVNTPAALLKVFTAAQKETWGPNSRPMVMSALMYLLNIGVEFTNTARPVRLYHGLSNTFNVYSCDFSIRPVIIEGGKKEAWESVAAFARGSRIPRHFSELEYKAEYFFEYFQACIRDFEFNEAFFAGDYRAFITSFFHRLEAHFVEAIGKYKLSSIKERHRLLYSLEAAIQEDMWKNLYVIPESATRKSLMENLRDRLMEYREDISAGVSKSGEEGYVRAGFFLETLNEVLKDPDKPGQLNRLFFAAKEAKWKSSAMIVMPHLLKLLGVECRFENTSHDSLVVGRDGRVHYVYFYKCKFDMEVKPLITSVAAAEAGAGAGAEVGRSGATAFAPAMSEGGLKISKTFELYFDLKDLAMFFMEYLKIPPLEEGHFSEERLDVFRAKFFEAFKGFLDERERIAKANREEKERYAASADVVIGL